MPLPLHFISGLPRSGTTLLVNLLGQNPAHHVGPTSGLIHLVRAVQGKWTDCQEFRAQGLETARPFVRRGLAGLMAGFYREQFDAGQTVFDKSRGWVHYVELVEDILGQPVKVITMVRDVRAIAASWEKVYRTRGIEYSGLRNEEKNPKIDTVAGRTKWRLTKKNVTGRSIRRVRDALDRCPDRLIVVPYARFTSDPIGVLKSIHGALGLPPFEYDPNHVEQITHEDDNVLGAELHTIRPKVEPAPEEPWRGVIPDALADLIARTYADLNALSDGPVLDGGRPC